MVQDKISWMTLQSKVIFTMACIIQRLKEEKATYILERHLKTNGFPNTFRICDDKVEKFVPSKRMGSLIITVLQERRIVRWKMPLVSHCCSTQRGYHGINRMRTKHDSDISYPEEESLKALALLLIKWTSGYNDTIETSKRDINQFIIISDRFY